MHVKSCGRHVQSVHLFQILGGTYEEKRKHDLCRIFLCSVSDPSVGMLLPQTRGSATENRKLALWPQLRTEEGWNTDFLSEAGEYFQDHFGFRQQLVTANALINGKIFGVSTADGVIQGKNGWLYYKDSLSDYLAQSR